MDGHTIDIHSQTQQLELNTNLTVPCESKINVLLKRFLLNGHTIGLNSQNQMLEPGC